MAWQTSIEAAQRFLRSVKTLSSYGDIVEKQNAGVLRALNKVVTLSPTQASTWLQQIDETLWKPSHVEGFREAVAAKTTSVVELTTREKLCAQDYSRLPYFLSASLVASVAKDDGDRDHLMFRVATHAKLLGLRYGTEASKANIVVLAYWSQVKYHGQSLVWMHQKFIEKKPTVTKMLTAQAANCDLKELPLLVTDLPAELRAQAFTEHDPVTVAEFAFEVTQMVKAMALRNSHRDVRGSNTRVGTPQVSSGSVDGTVVPVDTVVRILSAAKDTTPLVANGSTQAVQSGAAGKSQALLALEDGSVSEPPVPKQDLEVSGQAAAPVLTLEEQLVAMRRDSPKEDSTQPKPTKGKGMKRPSAKSKPSAVKGEGPKSVMKSLPKTKAKPKGKAAAKAKATGLTPREQLLKLIPQRILNKYKKGCSRCRDRPYCTTSCWAKRGYTLPWAELRVERKKRSGEWWGVWLVWFITCRINV